MDNKIKSEDLERFFSLNLDLLCIADTDGNFIKVNKEFERVLGYTEDELLSKKFIEFVHTKDKDKTIKAIKDLKNQKQVADFVNRLLCKDGSYRYFEWRSCPYENLIYSTARDITKKVKIEEQLLIEKDNAKKANKKKSDFLANISHEIRTPLNAVISITDFLEKTKLSNEQSEFVSVLKDSTNNLMFFIEQILDISKIENSTIKIDRFPFLIRDLIKKLVSFNEMKIKEKNLTFTQNIDANLPKVLIGDDIRLYQILINFFSNAIKFTEKGRIEFNIKVIEKSEKICKIQFSIADTGIGITKKNKSSVFKKFEQVDTSLTRKHGGIGLGLYLSKNLVDLMGGNIWFEDNKPVGSVFIVELDFIIGTLEDYKAFSECLNKDYENVLSKNQYKILVAEDDKTNQFVIKNLFKKYNNIEIDIVENGIDAYEFYEEENYDLIIMDVHMPHLDGISAANLIREYEKRKNLEKQVPIIFLTATTIEQLSPRLKDIAINGYILKPVIPEDFYSKISSILSIKSQELITEIEYTEEQQNKINTLQLLCNETIEIEKALNIIGGEFELYSALVKQYIIDYQNNANEIEQVFKEKNTENVLFYAHKLVTSSANIGAYNLSAICKNIENILNDNLLIDDKLLSNFIDEFNIVNEVIVEIDKFL